MPISSFLAPSAIAKPGVCTSTTRPASPYQGQVIYQTDTNTTLVWNGSGWVLLSTGTANPPGLELVKTQTVGSAVSSVTVSNAFSSTYDNYKILYYGGTSSTQANIKMQLGSSITAYYGSILYGAWNANTVQGAATGNAANFIWAGALNINCNSANIDLSGPYLSQFTYLTANNVIYGTTYGIFTGDHEVATSYTDFTFIPGAGTMTGGTIAVYGYRKS